MTLNPSSTSSLEQLALKGLTLLYLSLFAVEEKLRDVSYYLEKLNTDTCVLQKYIPSSTQTERRLSERIVIMCQLICQDYGVILKTFLQYAYKLVDF